MKNKISNGMKKIKQILKSKFRSGLKTLPYFIIAILVGVTAVYAGNLTPPGAPAKTMHSLSDLYTLINTSNEASPISSVYQAPSEVAPTMNTLEEIYTKTKTEIDLMKANGANKILTGNTFFGVAGTASAGPATLTWQDPDPALNLCWSYNTYEIESGNCSVGSGFTQTPDTLTTLGAVEYCKYLNANGTTLANTAQNIWHLPTIQEYSSITDYTRFNSATAVTGFAVDSLYWSGTEVAGDPYYAWYWGTDGGDTSYVDEVDNYSVRCAH